MKKGINKWSFPGGTPIADCLGIAKRAGYDGIELTLDESGELGLRATEKDARAIAAQAEAAGVEICGLATGLYWSNSMTSESEAVRARAMDICRKQLELAAAFGVDTILVVPGAVGVAFIPDFEVVDYEYAYDRALDAISRLADDARAAGVNIGLENVWNKFLLSPLELRGFIDAVNSPYVGAYFDVGNVLATGYPEQWVRILGKRIKKVHVKDYRLEAGGLHGFVDLLAGDVDFPAVMNALEAVGYDGYLIAEMGTYKHDPYQMVYNASLAMDRILEGRRG
ncbi:sugar phosphate isomerase/epimerase [Paenibacillus sp. MWE-103]|uniref:Sugar phosphate isomerase/epimerase n=1 Tax=Paenibacillus artemisiicola TaxID=1172618 RepID=A0ABS3WEY8_9BACL|nr:sugar phosphate isomerase/epimerase [Paenibacillus artemisiicola]